MLGERGPSHPPGPGRPLHPTSTSAGAFVQHRPPHRLMMRSTLEHQPAIFSLSKRYRHRPRTHAATHCSCSGSRVYTVQPIREPSPVLGSICSPTVLHSGVPWPGNDSIFSHLEASLASLPVGQPEQQEIPDARCQLVDARFDSRGLHSSICRATSFHSLSSFPRSLGSWVRHHHLPSSILQGRRTWTEHSGGT
jgi:hypothetical protein